MAVPLLVRMSSDSPKVVGIQGRGLGLVIVALVFVVVATATVIGRLLSRASMKRSIGKDDYAMVCSLVSWLSVLPQKDLDIQVHVLTVTDKVCSIAFTIINCIGILRILLLLETLPYTTKLI